MLDTILSRLHPSECQAVITNAVTTTTTAEIDGQACVVCAFALCRSSSYFCFKQEEGERKLFSQAVNIKHPINLLRGWSVFVVEN